ncbi:unnamed protein product [Brachionus calyciflorus]|uniref:Uncharacterized protein n=1 Tax=Brachionus calyciflorus TaxID=104777 RepID=A0A813X9X3_9BILA|nr:unnamed protein product [Brachionus calyciflorus]
MDNKKSSNNSSQRNVLSMRSLVVSGLKILVGLTLHSDGVGATKPIDIDYNAVPGDSSSYPAVQINDHSNLYSLNDINSTTTQASSQSEPTEK